MRTLRMAVKDVYFQQIKAGIKPFEFRLKNQYWIKKLEGREYDTLIITSGYPKSTDTDKIYSVPYRGYEIQNITHEHFGPNPVEVFAIRT